MSPASKERLRAAWPHLRAALVAFHVIAIGLAAIPAPVGGMDKRAWKDPTVQEEISAWGDRLGVESKSLQKQLWSVATAWMSARRVLLAPFKPYLDASGCDQPWRMFVAAHRYPTRFQVQVRGPGAQDGEDGWETLFEERSDRFTWRRDFFDYDRVRGALFQVAWPGRGADYHRACKWVAKRAFAERADAGAARCRFYKYRLPTPAEAKRGVEPEGRWIQEWVVKRAEGGT